MLPQKLEKYHAKLFPALQIGHHLRPGQPSTQQLRGAFFNLFLREQFVIQHNLITMPLCATGYNTTYPSPFFVSNPFASYILQCWASRTVFHLHRFLIFGQKHILICCSGETSISMTRTRYRQSGTIGPMTLVFLTQMPLVAPKATRCMLSMPQMQSM
jgi:hypothetical protein